MKFWLLWAIDAVIAAVALFFFLTGLADGSVSSFNMGLWTIILAALAAVVGGSLWIKSTGRTGLAMLLLLILAVPGILFALFLLVVIVSEPRWN